MNAVKVMKVIQEGKRFVVKVELQSKWNNKYLCDKELEKRGLLYLKDHVPYLQVEPDKDKKIRGGFYKILERELSKNGFSLECTLEM